MNVGWILLWQPTGNVRHLLSQTGFKLGYRADGASVYQRTGPKS
jgi:hypothetical protein